MPSEPSAKPTLGRLEKLNPCEYWQAGAADFVTWLRQPDNLALVSDAVGLPLSLVGDEEDAEATATDLVTANLLCQNTATADWVLITTQLDPSDAFALGQLITQTAVLRAKTVVWVASQFLPEHRATLDWLNTLGHGQMQFFGVELELWGIGKAAMAVDFTPVSIPAGATDSPHGEEADAVDSEAIAEPPEEPEPEPEPEPLTEEQQQNLDFWSCLGEALDDRGSIVKPGNPTPQETAGFAIGRAGFRLYTTLDREAARLMTELHLADDDAHAHFYLLAEQQDLIEADLDDHLIWDDHGEDGTCSIYCTLEEVDIDDRDRWPEYIEWLCDRLEAFHHAFSDRIKSLDAATYTPLPQYSFNPLQGSLSLPGSLPKRS